jgi:hypothetical protein
MLHLVGFFCMNCAMMQRSTNIKFKKLSWERRLMIRYNHFQYTYFLHN